MRELELLQENLEYQQRISEKNLIGSTAKIVDNATDKLKDWAFEWGTSLVLRLFRSGDHKSDSEAE